VQNAPLRNAIFRVRYGPMVQSTVSSANVEHVIALPNLRREIELQREADPRKGLEYRRLIFALLQDSSLNQYAKRLLAALNAFEGSIIDRQPESVVESGRRQCLDIIDEMIRITAN